MARQTLRLRARSEHCQTCTHLPAHPSCGPLVRSSYRQTSSTSTKVSVPHSRSRAQEWDSWQAISSLASDAQASMWRNAADKPVINKITRRFKRTNRCRSVSIVAALPTSNLANTSASETCAMCTERQSTSEHRYNRVLKQLYFTDTIHRVRVLFA